MPEMVVFVIVKIDNLNAFSKFMLSTIKIPERKNKLIKKEIRIKKDTFMLSSVIFFSEPNIFLFITLLGLINLIISEEDVFNKTYILVNLIPDVLEISEPPIKVNNIKYKLKLLSEFIRDNPELPKLLITLMIIFNPL